MQKDMALLDGIRCSYLSCIVLLHRALACFGLVSASFAGAGLP